MNIVEREELNAGHSELKQQVLELAPGEHLCLFYENDPAEQMPALVPFVQQGLWANEQVVYIADDYSAEELAHQLKRNGIEVHKEAQRDRLRLWTRREWRQAGELDSQSKALQVRRFIEQASVAGFSGIRFAVEMTWTLGPDIGVERLERWEATINTLFETAFPARIICQYNRSRLSPEALVAALHTHPKVILNDCVYPNFFYQAPLILQSAPNSCEGLGHSNNGNGKASAARLQWMLAQLERARAAENQRDELIRKETELAQIERSRHQLEVKEQRLREVLEQYRQLAAIVESSDDAIVTKDLNGIITSWNSGAERVFGYTAQEAIGNPVTILIPPDHSNEEPHILERIRKGERVDHYETVRVRKDGTLIDISLTVSPLKDSSGRILGASKIARDITERKRAEAALRETKQQLACANEHLEARVQQRTASLQEAIAQMEEFSYTVSHDLRGPIRAMQGYARAIEEDFGQHMPPEAKEYLQRIIRGGTRMDRLIQDLLTYSRLVRREVQLQPVALDQLVRDLIHQNPDLQPPSAEISLMGALAQVMAHEPSLTQAVTNLLTNAVKFVPPGETPKVRIGTQTDHSWVRLSIEDNGIGIKPEHQHRVFGMFERLHPERNYEGTGVGLAIVRKAVERMGGRAGVESDGITGSRFWIELAAVPEVLNYGIGNGSGR